MLVSGCWPVANMDDMSLASLKEMTTLMGSKGDEAKYEQEDDQDHREEHTCPLKSSY